MKVTYCRLQLCPEMHAIAKITNIITIQKKNTKNNNNYYSKNKP